jgi:prepilin peptidase CpaA
MESIGFWHVAIAVLLPGVVLASWIDWRYRKVPNWLNLSLILSGLTVQVIFHGWSGLWAGLLGMLLGFGLLIIPWLMHAMGAGDVKLMAAIGVWLGPLLTLRAFCVGAILAGAIAVTMIILGRRLWQAYANLGLIMTKLNSWKKAFSDFGSVQVLKSTSQLLPYGVPLSIGTLVVVFSRGASWWTF